jgi:tetratricopeptide (TPR) repeat protein
MKTRLFLAVLLLSPFAIAQLNSAPGAMRHVRVRLAFSDGSCNPSVRVTLLGHAGQVVQGGAPNEQCEVEFFNIPEGSYHVNVITSNSSQLDAGSVDATLGSAEFEVKVNESAGTQAAAGLTSNPISVSALHVPPQARKDFDKANALIQKQDFDGAIRRLNKAVAEYPSYASAYNNLGAIYGRMGDRDRERECLQKAVAADDHFAPAYVNLGKLNIKTEDFRDAETALSKASGLDPEDATTLVLLTYTEFMNHHYDDVIATSKKAHLLSSEHAFAHQVAARAYEQKRDAANAMAELEQFLKEEPSGPRADIAHKELAALHAAFPNLSAGLSQ